LRALGANLYAVHFAVPMQNEDLQEIVLRVLASRARGERHIGKESLSGLSVRGLIDDTTAVLRSEPALLSPTGCFVVVGDLHGSIHDLLQILSAFEYPPAQSYLFLGDYVDRGANSVEVLLVLYALKVLFPHHIYLLRGNHEGVRLQERVPDVLQEAAHVRPVL
jgi:protein phosphatase